MPNTEMPAGPAVGPAALPDLPDKLRVHALAKLVGRTSKEVQAALADLGIEVRSAQSSVDRVAAEKVAATFAPPADTPVAEAPSADVELPETAAPPAPRPRRRRATRAAAPAAESPATESPATESPATESSVTGAPTADDLQVTDAAPEPVLDLPAEWPSDAGTAAPVFAPAVPLFQPPARPSRSRRRVAAEPVDEPAEAEVAPPAVPEPVEEGRTEDARAEPDTDPGDGDDLDEDGNRRRRRRGRRGRGRGKGGEDEAGGEADDDGTDGTDGVPAAAESDETEEADEESADEDDDENRPSGSRRRRRRRRRGGAGDDEARDDDPPATVTRVRAPRERSVDTADGGDGVQGVRGSTRLEAKRQRRRDGRDAGRRRTPVLSESEFLARREAVERTMVVRERGDRVEIGVLEDEVLVEHFVADSGDRDGTSMVGNIYLGRVQNVLPSMEAAFVDIGRGRNAVLYAGEVDWDAAGLGGKARRIEQALSSGDSVLVQVTKDPIGHKGARLTTQISLAGRFLVYVPSGGAAGISRKLPDVERKRLKDLLRDIVPAEAGVIIRTASEGVEHEALERDVRRLQAQWEIIDARAKQTGPAKPKAPTLLYEEPDLLIKVVRDQFNEDFARLIVQGDDAWDALHGYLSHVAPELSERTHRHVGSQDVFAEHRIDEQLLKALDRKVWLPSGGTLVIDRTEAMTVVDVNTGKYTGSGGNLEETVTRNNLEAAEEVVRQLRLRDIGGIIVVDFIDMVLESNRDLVLKRLTECLSRDRTRHQVAEVTSLGLVQMTRKRVGGGLLEHFSTPCEHCRGRGVVVEVETPAEPGRGDRDGRRSRGGRRRGGDNGPTGNGNGGPADVAAAGRNGRVPAHDPVLDVGAPAGADDLTGGTGSGAVEEAVVEEAGAAPVTGAVAARPVPVPSVVAEPEESALGEADRNGHQSRPARRRGRVTRSAGAPTATAADGPDAGAGVVTIEPGAPAEQVPVPADTAAADTVPADTAPVIASPVIPVPEQPEPAAATTRPRRTRRAASRPAGPPPGGDPTP